MGISLVQMNECEKAIPELELALKIMGETPATLGSLGRAYARAGKFQQAEAIIARLKILTKQKSVTASSLAAVYVGLGDFDQAIAWLARAVANRSSWMVFLYVEPMSDPLRDHPRFPALQCSIRS